MKKSIVEHFDWILNDNLTPQKILMDFSEDLFAFIENNKDCFSEKDLEFVNRKKLQYIAWQAIYNDTTAAKD